MPEFKGVFGKWQHIIHIVPKPFPANSISMTEVFVVWKFLSTVCWLAVLLCFSEIIIHFLSFDICSPSFENVEEIFGEVSDYN